MSGLGTKRDRDKRRKWESDTAKRKKWKELCPTSWIKEYRQTGFGKCLSDASKFIEKSSYDLPIDFKHKRGAKKKRMFDYEDGNQPIEFVKSRYET
ncbi:hypothetical protein TNCV_5058401 [Trichonephila clavipes]|nr:hypothetical protein TNCV_5058401 [Trichonephila clavipes]